MTFNRIIIVLLCILVVIYFVYRKKAEKAEICAENVEHVMVTFIMEYAMILFIIITATIGVAFGRLPTGSSLVGMAYRSCTDVQIEEVTFQFQSYNDIAYDIAGTPILCSAQYISESGHVETITCNPNLIADSKVLYCVSFRNLYLSSSQNSYSISFSDAESAQELAVQKGKMFFIPIALIGFVFLGGIVGCFVFKLDSLLDALYLRKKN